MEEEREVCTGLHNGETTLSQLHEARCTGSPSCLSSRCTKDANLTPVLDLSSPAAGFPTCCPKVVTKLSQSCPLSIFLIATPMLQALFLVVRRCHKIVSKLSSFNLTPVLDLSSPAAGFPTCCPKVVTKLSQSCPLSIFLIATPMLQALLLIRPLLVLVLLRDLLGRLLAGPCLLVYLSTCVVVYSSTCLLV